VSDSWFVSWMSDSRQGLNKQSTHRRPKQIWVPIGIEKEKYLSNGFERSNFGPWDFHVAAEKDMQLRTWGEA
jgi:hypothetical protein